MSDALLQALEQTNVASQLSEDQLNEISDECIRGFDADEESRGDWLDKVKEYVKLATQVSEKKSYPWPNASNVKFPLLSTAALQFAARAYPALIPGTDLVKAIVIGRDNEQTGVQRAERISRHMSYQILYQMEDWEEHMDKLCIIVPIVGCAFKKTFFDPIKKLNVSELVQAEYLSMNYWAKSLENCPRKTHILYLFPNQVEEKKRAGLFLDVELMTPTQVYDPFDKVANLVTAQHEPDQDETTPHTFLEQHTYLDLDNDGYKEPWIITVDYFSKKVVRIVPNFDQDGLVMDGDKLIRITPNEYFTKFSFFPNPDGGVYDVGFGLMLGDINHSVNTITNQLIDAGHLATLQGGFIGRGIRVKGGNLRFTPGEWKQADFTGEEISKNIFPLPVKEPSAVLFSMFEALVQSGKELASVAEIMTGKLPGQNTPATTTQASIDQSLKIFTAVYKRLYRALTSEYKKLYKLNSKNLDEKVYFTINADSSQQQQAVELLRTDYQDDILVKPNADPNVSTETQQLLRSQALLELMPLGLNPKEVARRILESRKEPNIPALLEWEPPPDPKVQEMQMKAQMEQEKNQAKAQIDQMKAEMEKMKMMFEMEIEKAKAEMEMQIELMKAQMEMELKEQEFQQELRHSDVKHSQELQQVQQGALVDQKAADIKLKTMEKQHEMKLQQAAEIQETKPKEKKKRKLRVKESDDGSFEINEED